MKPQQPRLSHNRGDIVRPEGVKRSRGSLGVIGPLHRGFGFEPEEIISLSKKVAQRCADEAEAKRRQAKQVALHESVQRPLPPPFQGTLATPHDAAGNGSAAEQLQWAPVPHTVPAAPTSLSEMPPEKNWEESPQVPSLKQISVPRPVVDCPTPRVGQREGALGQVRQRELGSPNRRPTPGPVGAAAVLGARPGPLSVCLGVFVDSAVAFALLTLINLAAHIGNWAVRTRFIHSEMVAWHKWVPDWNLGMWHWIVVLCVWALALYLLQFFFMAMTRSTLGRFLAGVVVNPVASRNGGWFSLPLYEVVTFGGLFVLPLSLLKPDRHALAGAIRFHIPNSENASGES